MKTRLLTLFCSLTMLSYFNLSHAVIEEGQLVIWVDHNHPSESIKEIAQNFEKENNVKVKIYSISSHDKKFELLAKIEYGPDLILATHENVGNWANSHVIASPDISDDFKSKFEEYSWKTLQYNNQVWGIPYAANATMLICNNDILTDIPTNFEDFKDLDFEFRLKDKRSLHFDYKNPMFGYPFMTAKEGYIFQYKDGEFDKNNIGFVNDGTKYGLSFISNYINEGYMDSDIDKNSIDDLFIENKLGCVLGDFSDFINLKAKSLNVSVNKLPNLNANKTKSLVQEDSFFISKASPNKELAEKFLTKYLFTDEGIAKMYKDKSIGLSSFKSFNSKMLSDSSLSVFSEIVKDGDILPNVPEISLFWYAYSEIMKQSVSDISKVDSALEEAKQKLQK